MNIALSHSDLIKQHSSAIAQYASQIRYQEHEAEPDTSLIHELKALYETEKQRLEDAWKRVQRKGEDFLTDVVKIVQEFFEELVSDVLAFLKRHGLDAIVEFLKDLF